MRATMIPTIFVIFVKNLPLKIFVKQYLIDQIIFISIILVYSLVIEINLGLLMPVVPYVIALLSNGRMEKIKR